MSEKIVDLFNDVASFQKISDVSNTEKGQNSSKDSINDGSEYFEWAPEIKVPFDDSTVDRINSLNFGDKKNNINAFRVEQNLISISEKLNTCVSLKEKAQEIQLRALADAIEIHALENIFPAQSEIEALIWPGTDENKVFVRSLRDKIENLQEMRPKFLKIRATEKGHGSNYAERYSFIRLMFNELIEDVYVRCRVAEESLRSIYAIDLPLPDLSQFGYLDTLMMWVKHASDKLESTIDNRKKLFLSLSVGSNNENPVNALLKKSEFDSRKTSGSLTFKFENLFAFREIKNPLIRSLAIEFISKNVEMVRKYIPISVVAPFQKLASSEMSVDMVAVVGDFSTAKDFSTSEFFNVNPVSGDWTIRFNHKTIDDSIIPPEAIEGIVLHLILSVE